MSPMKFPLAIYHLGTVSSYSATKRVRINITVSKDDIDAFLGDVNNGTRPKSAVHHNIQTLGTSRLIDRPAQELKEIHPKSP
jgi:hypothetical protein